MGSSVEKMDRTADPKRDFVRHAAGKWINAASIPADTVRVSSPDLLSRQVQRQVTATDPHPPGLYRMASPSQHQKGFYEALGITASDPMWLPEKDRVAIW